MTQHPDHIAALALIEAGHGWAADAILAASKAPRSAAALAMLRAGRLTDARAQMAPTTEDAA